MAFVEADKSEDESEVGREIVTVGIPGSSRRRDEHQRAAGTDGFGGLASLFLEVDTWLNHDVDVLLQDVGQARGEGDINV